jgi:hypothetical protein
LIEEYENKNSHRLDNEEQICYDEKSPGVPNEDDEKVNNSNENKMMSVDTGNYNNNYVDSHKGKNCHSKTSREDEGLDLEYLKPELKSKIKEEIRKHKEEQLILLKEYKQNIIDFLLHNKDSIRIEDLKIYEPIYKCYREKGHCFYCNTITNIICKNCSNNHEKVWLCTNHWQDHLLQK